MSTHPLQGQRIAILTTDGFEQSELFGPRAALEAAGAEVEVISPHEGSVKGWKDKNWGESVEVDVLLSEADPDRYQALMLPGGVMNPDKLRIDKTAIKFVQAFVDSGRPIAAICHGPQVLIETGVVRGRRMTSWPSLKTDLVNAGAEWVDEEVVVDNGLVTSRKPDDIPAFSLKMIELFAEGIQASGEKSTSHGKVEGTPSEFANP